MSEEKRKGKIITSTRYIQYLARGNYMERSFKKIWILRFLALLITSVALATVVSLLARLMFVFGELINLGIVYLITKPKN